MIEKVVGDINEYIGFVQERINKDPKGSFADINIRFTTDAMAENFKRYWISLGYRTVNIQKCQMCKYWDILIQK